MDIKKFRPDFLSVKPSRQIVNYVFQIYQSQMLLLHHHHLSQAAVYLPTNYSKRQQNQGVCDTFVQLVPGEARLHEAECKCWPSTATVPVSVCTYSIISCRYQPTLHPIKHPVNGYIDANQTETNCNTTCGKISAAMALRIIIHTGMMDVHQSPMSFLVRGIHTPPCPNAISPSGSVMII